MDPQLLASVYEFQDDAGGFSAIQYGAVNLGRRSAMRAIGCAEEHLKGGSKMHLSAARIHRHVRWSLSRSSTTSARGAFPKALTLVARVEDGLLWDRGHAVDPLGFGGCLWSELLAEARGPELREAGATEDAPQSAPPAGHGRRTPLVFRELLPDSGGGAGRQRRPFGKSFFWPLRR